MMNEEERVARPPECWATLSSLFRDAGIRPVIQVSLPSCQHPYRHSGISPVIPAKAGIYVASPVSYARELANRHTKSRDVFGFP